MKEPITSAARQNAFASIEEQLLSMPAIEGVLLRLELVGDRAAYPAGHDARHGPTAAHDPLRGLAASLADVLLQHQQPNGSWHDDLFATCDALRTLRDLRAADAYDHAHARAIAWLRARLGEPGRFGEGCDASRHAAGLCEHFLPPFCSPGHAHRDLGGARLPDGTVFGSDAEARLCAAATAFREFAAARVSGTSMQLQRAALRRIAVAAHDGAKHGLDAQACACLLDALRHAREPADKPALHAAARAVVARQRGEGSWPNGGEYVLDALSRACGEDIAEVQAALRRAGEHIAWVHVSRSVRGESPRRLLVAWRTLRCIATRAG